MHPETGPSTRQTLLDIRALEGCCYMLLSFASDTPGYIIYQLSSIRTVGGTTVVISLHESSLDKSLASLSLSLEPTAAALSVLLNYLE